MKLVLVTTPRRCAWTIPRLIPGEYPKSSALTTRNRDTSRDSEFHQESACDSRGFELLLGERASGTTVANVIAVDRLHGVGGLVDIRDCEETLPGREDRAETRVLRDNRFSGREIAHVSLAEPAAAEAHVLILGDCELGARAAKVVLIVTEDVE